MNQLLLWTLIGVAWVALSIPAGLLLGRVLARRNRQLPPSGDFVPPPHDVGKSISEVKS